MDNLIQDVKKRKLKKSLPINLDPEPVKEPVKEPVREIITKEMVQEPPRVIREFYSTVREVPKIIQITKTVRKPAKRRKRVSKKTKK